MKKLIAFTISTLMVIVGLAFAKGGDIQCIHLVTGGTILASGSSTYANPSGTTDSVISLETFNPEQNYSLQIEIKGAGSAVRVDYLLSNDRIDFVDCFPTYICSGVTPDSGITIFSFTPALAPYMKIRATETGGAAVSGITMTLCVQ